MAVNYMDRLAALRGDHQHAAGAHGRVSAPVLHADEEKKRRKKKRKLSRKQKAALAKGRKKMAQMRRAKRRKSMPRKRRRRHARETAMVVHRKSGGGKGSVPYKKTKKSGPSNISAKARTRKHKRIAAKKYYGKRKGKTYLTTRTPKIRKKRRASAKRRRKTTAMVVYRAKRRTHKRKKAMGHRKSAKRVAAGKKAARTRKRHKAERAAARRRGGRRHHKRKRVHHRAAPRRRRHRKRGGHARRRYRGYVRRAGRGRHGGQFVARGGRQHGRRVTRRYHKAGRITREGYSMENPLDMGELATGLATGLVGYVAADLVDRYLASSQPPFGGTPDGMMYAAAAPIWSNYLRLGVGLAMGALPLASAHFIDGAKHRHLRAAVQFFGFGAGLRTLGHLVDDLLAMTMKNNTSMQPLFAHEITAQGMLAGVQKTGAAGLPEHIVAAAYGMGAIPEGLAACCNATSRMLNPSLSPLQPIGRNLDGGGSSFAAPPQALPPPIERIVQQPYSPPVPSTPREVMQRMDQQPQHPRNGGGGGGVPVSPPTAALVPNGRPVAPAMTSIAPAPAAAPAAMMAAAYPIAGAAPGGVPVGAHGLPQSPFGWGEDNE
jgi:hypothetical protein